MATYQHLHDRYGWVPDAWEVILEPDNVSQWNGTLIGRAIVATADRLNANGFRPAFIAPSNTNMANAITYFDQMVQVPGVLQHLKEFSYHRYGGVSSANLQTIASRAKQFGVDTSMLEWWSNSNGYRTLHEDLKVGNNSAWQQGVIAGAPDAATALYKIDASNPDKPVVLIGDKTKFLRQYYKFIRPGAIRIEASSNSSSFDPLAFINPNSRYVVVVKADAGGNFSVQSLPAGTYGIKYTTASEYDRDLPDQSITSGQTLTTSIPEIGLLAIYQKCQGTNSKAADLNNDWVVNLKDLTVLANYWLRCLCLEPYWCECSDFNQSGRIDFSDFVRLAQSWLSRWNQPPWVNIIKPQEGTVISLPCEILADAADIDGSVVKVEFFADFTWLGQDGGSADGWKISWQSYPASQYSLAARATDDDGATATSPAVAVTVSPYRPR